MTTQNPATQPSSQPHHLRSLAAVILTGLPVIAVAWTVRIWRDNLPDPLPTHWSALSSPDGFTSYDGTWRVLLAVTVAGAIFGILGGALSWLNPLWQRSTAGLGAAAGFGALGLWLAIAWSAWDRTDAHGAQLGEGIALPIAAGLAGPALVLAVIGRRPRTLHTARTGSGPSSSLVLAPGERAVWAHREFVVWPLVIGVVLAVAAVVMVLVADPVPALVVAAAALTAAVLSWVQVTVDQRGLRIGLGPWAWTVKKVPVEAIASASGGPIEAADWGGWGYRVVPGRSALVLRSGPAIVLDLTDGRRFAVTVQDPEPAVALLEALRVRAAA